MPRLKGPNGVTVSVSDETAVLLGSEWAPVEEPKPSRSKSESSK